MAHGEVKYITHGPEVCGGEPCPIHNPSDHPLNKAPINVRWDRRIWVNGELTPYALTERICAHGVGHPDLDCMKYLLDRGADEAEGIHGCDGCCQGRVPA